MMAGLASTGRLWLFVILTGTINGYPTNKALDPLGAFSANPSSGSSRKDPDPEFVQAQSAFATASNPAVLLHPDEQPAYINPSSQIRPVPALHGSNVFPAPAYQRVDGGVPVGSTQPRFQSPPNQVQWAVQPPSPFYGRISSPSEPRIASESPGYMSPPAPFPLFQPGEAAYEEKTYEQGEYDSESEDKGIPFQYFPARTLNEFAISSPMALGTLVDRFRLGHPLIEYMLLNRRYPPGTYTFSTDQLDHRKNQWHDSRYTDPYTSGQKQLEALSYPYGKRHLLWPVQQSGNAGYGV